MARKLARCLATSLQFKSVNRFDWEEIEGGRGTRLCSNRSCFETARFQNNSRRPVIVVFFDSRALRLFKTNLHQFPLKRVEIVHQRNALVEAERARRLSVKLIDAFLKVCPKQQAVR